MTLARPCGPPKWRSRLGEMPVFEKSSFAQPQQHNCQHGPHLGLILASLGLILAHLGPILASSCPSWPRHPSWPHRGPILVDLGPTLADLGPYWPHLGRPWPQLGSHRPNLGLILAHLCLILAPGFKIFELRPGLLDSSGLLWAGLLEVRVAPRSSDFVHLKICTKGQHSSAPDPR